jgi:hypothetical protein
MNKQAARSSVRVRVNRRLRGKQKVEGYRYGESEEGKR